ncbi:PREDICTED: F-box protein SKIP23-like [Fragaria vesca subsp. vesca]|uniref:F-box protein SKIP23-like n=1 Tax=Fragaria vesca subsp. vesca TaxID=101020 RepID=UPI0002C2FE35|nr:PREDICTED: F-box protein SKIP23-like [Fragaria vesca subsp. vesca]
MSKRAKFSPANWSDLPQDLVLSIARRIGSAQDFVTFGAVCKTWSRAFTKQDFLGGLTHAVPLLMLPKYSDNTQECYNLTRGRFCRLDINLSEAKAKRMPPKWYYCHSSLGWLILPPQNEDSSNPVCMFHPFNHTRIVLPTYGDGDSIENFVLSSSPSFPSDYTAMISYRWTRRAAFWRPKDKRWINVSLPTRPPNLYGNCFDDIAFYKGQFYVAERMPLYENFLVCDIDDHKAEGKLSNLKSNLFPCHGGKRTEHLNLVESAGDLLVVLRYSFESSHRIVGFRVFKVPFDTDDWTEVEDLGNRALFLGDNSSFSVETSPGYSRCKANCIYFTTDRVCRQQCGVFSMEDRQVKPLLHKFAWFENPYIWIQPSL